MFFHKFGDTYAIRLERGEELAASLKELCVTERVRLGTLSGWARWTMLWSASTIWQRKRFCPNVLTSRLR
ncbi:MAG: hypothetical protein ACLVL7_11280 [Anaerotruncus massiliensis (ex Togo et al. 2019)]